MADGRVDDWLRSGEYLPPSLRDFHDQKDLFKAMHERMDVRKSLPQGEDVSWPAGQCYVIDFFLWFMARRGWTLQRSRRRFDFADLDADVAESKKIRSDSFFAMLNADRGKSRETG